MAPDYLGKYFIKRLVVHNTNTRQCNNFVIPQCRLSMGQRAFYFRGPREWNVDSFMRTLFFYNMFIRNNFEHVEYGLNNFECILNLIKLP